jgi:prevent-host-death family protein
MVIMMTAAVAELKARLSRYLKQVKAGEEVLVTERGAPVARLVPVGAVEHDEIEELERQGLVRRGTGVLPKNFWTMPRPRDARATVRRAVAEEREGGW